MKFEFAMLLLVLSTLALSVSGVVHQFPIGYRPNLKQRLSAEGKLEEYQKAKMASAKPLQLASSSSPIIDYEDMAYMVQITLGTPAQNFVLFIDSGSSNLWVPDVTCAGGKDATCGSYCKSTPYDACLTFCQEECCTKTIEGGAPKVLAAADACQSKHHFNSSKSTTYVSNGQKFDMTYNTGEVKGFFGVDQFCFTNTTLCADNQIFGQAQTIGEAFGKQPEDGIIGLGWPALAVNQQTPPLFNLLNQGKLDQPYFVVHLATIGPTSQLNGGTFTVGGLDTTHCASQVDWVPLTSETFWQFKLSGISAGTYTQTPGTGWQTAADTAASFIGAPKTVVDKLAKAVGATYIPLSGAYFIDCDAVAPDIVFTINGRQYNMPSTSFVVSAGPGLCMFAFYDLTAGGFYPAWMLGPPFMRAYCHVHDMQNGRLGLAKVL